DSSITDTGSAVSTTGTLSSAGNLSVNSNAFVVDATNKKIGIGTSTITSSITVDSSDSILDLGTFSDTNASMIIGKRARNTSASPDSVQNADYLLSIAGYGRGTTSYGQGASIDILATSTWTDANHSSAIAFNTVSTTASLERMRISEIGNVGIGTPLPSARLHVSGSFRLENGSEGAGKVLVSDSAGVGTWQVPGVIPTAILPNDAVNIDFSSTRFAKVAFTAPFSGNLMLSGLADGGEYSLLIFGAPGDVFNIDLSIGVILGNDIFSLMTGPPDDEDKMLLKIKKFGTEVIITKEWVDTL
ncbi:MAG: hypothetical protein KDD25_06250, partial [Bdellovibrionales bacterium]|nr:hypothetical protein [Bdellovibrionales bacterium]